jgi:hypothetical protein
MHERRIGRFTVRVERKGRGFTYDILRDGFLFAVGTDLLSQTAQAVFEKLATRYGTGA